jgi:hypothetical protein
MSLERESHTARRQESSMLCVRALEGDGNREDSSAQVELGGDSAGGRVRAAEGGALSVLGWVAIAAAEAAG